MVGFEHHKKKTLGKASKLTSIYSSNVTSGNCMKACKFEEQIHTYSKYSTSRNRNEI